MLKGLTEIFRKFGFTFEKILDCGSSHLAEILRKDTYVGELIYKKQKNLTVSFNFLINRKCY